SHFVLSAVAVRFLGSMADNHGKASGSHVEGHPARVGLRAVRVGDGPRPGPGSAQDAPVRRRGVFARGDDEMGAGDGGTAVTGGVDRVAALSGDQSGGVRRPCLTLAMSDYDHVRDLMYGRVGVEGVQLMPLTLSIEEIFYRFTK